MGGSAIGSQVGRRSGSERAGGVAGSSIDAAELLERGRRAGLAAVGITSAEIQQPARTVLHLRRSRGRAGTMQFTYRNPDRSTDPRSVLPSARSVVVGAWPYGHWTAGAGADGPNRGRVARYAWHDHYADLREALGAMAEPLREAGHKAVVVADTNGLVDRNAAWSAGLGWYGKNANLLVPDAGSWFVLGSVVTDADLDPTGPSLSDGCGPCTRCLDDCPTGAIVAPGVVDATRCLAWLVQADGVFPHRWRAALGDRIYGCDDCQEVCPPNRVAGPAADAGDGGAGGSDTVAASEQVAVELGWLLTAADDEILDRHGRWYIADRNVDNVRRSALIVLGNVGRPDDGGAVVLDLLTRHLGHDRPLLRAHALWAARRLGLEPHLSALAPSLADDRDPLVQDEWRVEVEPRFQPGAWGALVDAVVGRA
ncbi:MAG: tRNA epoxyqueuosine(34) reductase QueG [Actinomycetota bacterium]